jgi:GMP reductase
MTKPALHYKDVCLIPRYSEIHSRSDAYTQIVLGRSQYKIPVVPSNMKAVIDIPTARWMSKNGYFYIMHRFDQHLADDIGLANAEDWQTISFSVGVKMPDKIHIMNIGKDSNLRVDFLTVDVAHGHHERVKAMIAHIKKHLPDTKIIAGNVATSDAVYDLASWGADMVKVGIGQGNVCTTKDKTGFTMPMFSCVQECSDVVYDGKKVPIIADGGIRSNGDIAKALAAGAKVVMVGSMFSQCIDSPASGVVVDGRMYKQYFGSASEQNKGHTRHIEGVMKEIPSNNMTYEQKLQEIKQDLQSAVSYSGLSSSDIKDLPQVDYRIQQL